MELFTSNGSGFWYVNSTSLNVFLKKCWETVSFPVSPAVGDLWARGRTGVGAVKDPRGADLESGPSQPDWGVGSGGEWQGTALGIGGPEAAL